MVGVRLIIFDAYAYDGTRLFLSAYKCHLQILHFFLPEQAFIFQRYKRCAAMPRNRVCSVSQRPYASNKFLGRGLAGQDRGGCYLEESPCRICREARRVRGMHVNNTNQNQEQISITQYKTKSVPNFRHKCAPGSRIQVSFGGNQHLACFCATIVGSAMQRGP